MGLFFKDSDSSNSDNEESSLFRIAHGTSYLLKSNEDKFRGNFDMPEGRGDALMSEGNFKEDSHVEDESVITLYPKARPLFQEKGCSHFFKC